MRRKEPSELEQLISDYWKDLAFIKTQKYKWVELPPPSRDSRGLELVGDDMRKLPKSSEIEEMDQMKESKKDVNTSSAMKIMKAVTKHALNPKKKKVATKGQVQAPGSKPSKDVAAAEKQTSKDK